jgi:hypothetical protein
MMFKRTNPIGNFQSPCRFDRNSRTCQQFGAQLKTHQIVKPKFKFACSRCGQKLPKRPENSGQELDCAACADRFSVPEAPDAGNSSERVNFLLLLILAPGVLLGISNLGEQFSGRVRIIAFGIRFVLA